MIIVIIMFVLILFADICSSSLLILWMWYLRLPNCNDGTLSVTLSISISSSVQGPTSFSPSKTNQLNLVPSLNIICRKSNREFQWMFSYLLILSHIWWCINSNKTQLWSLDWLVCNFVTPVRDYRTADAWFRCAFGNVFLLSWSHNTWTIFKQTSLPG